MKNKKVIELEALLSVLSKLVNEIDQLSYGLYKKVILLKNNDGSTRDVVCLIDFLRDKYINEPKQSNVLFQPKNLSNDINDLLNFLPYLERYLKEILNLKKRTSGSTLLDNIYFSIASHLEEERFESILTSPNFLSPLTSYLSTQPSLLKLKILEFCCKDHHFLGAYKVSMILKIQNMLEWIKDTDFKINLADDEILGELSWDKLDIISSAAQQFLEALEINNDLQLEGSYGLY